MLGVISSRRDCCASWRVGSGRSSKCYTVSQLFSGRRNRGREVLGWFVELWISAESR